MFTPDSSQEYIVSTVDSNSCFNSDTVNVQVIVVPVNAGSDIELCYGDSVSLNGVGPNPIWSQGVLNGVGFIPDSSNDYILTVTDINGCIRYDTLNMVVHSLPPARLPATVVTRVPTFVSHVPAILRDSPQGAADAGGSPALGLGRLGPATCPGEWVSTQDQDLNGIRMLGLKASLRTQ